MALFAGQIRRDYWGLGVRTVDSGQGPRPFALAAVAFVLGHTCYRSASLFHSANRMIPTAAARLPCDARPDRPNTVRLRNRACQWAPSNRMRQKRVLALCPSSRAAAAPASAVSRPTEP